MPDQPPLRSLLVSTGQSALPRKSTGGQRAAIGIAIILFAVASAYLALVIITRVDSIFFPGNQLTLPGGSTVGTILPGVDAAGESGNQDRINILVIGLDKRARDGDGPSRTDTIFVVTVDPKTRSAGILGIPRDLIVDIPFKTGGGTYEDRINTVYVQGELVEYEGGGMGLMKRVLLEDLGIKIDKYVIVDFEGFEEIIDALNGIEVDVPDDVYDPYYSITEKPGDYFPVDIQAGRQRMDGKTALAYARVRFSSDDLDRIQRQQRVIFATIERAKSLNVLSNARSLWDKYKNTIKTDIDDALIPGYALLASQVMDDVNAVSIGPATVPYTTPRGAAVLVGDDEAIAQIVKSVFEDPPGSVPQPTVTPDPVRVQVRNGTGTDGLASRVINYIATRGYPLEDLLTGNAEASERSAIIDLDGTHEQNRLLLAKWLGIDLEQVRSATPEEAQALSGTQAEIVVILGEDFDESTLSSSAVITPGG